jgi:hypothetical protein
VQPNGNTTQGRRKRIHDTPFRARTIRAGLDLVLLPFLVLMMMASGCARAPLGPPFDRAPLPPEHRARIYLYRTDDRSSLATVRVTIDGQEVGRFRDHEYETLELAAGQHHLRAGMRGFGFIAWGWNEQTIHIRPGETVYFMISVRLAAQSTSTAREIDIAGRPSGAASENVFVLPRSAAEALSDLDTTTRLTRSGSKAD